MSLPIFSNQAFYNWIASRPPNARYDYYDQENCLICQYLKSCGFTDVHVDPWSMNYTDAAGQHYDENLPVGWNRVAMPGEYLNLTPTFEEGAKKAEVLALA